MSASARGGGGLCGARGVGRVAYIRRVTAVPDETWFARVAAPSVHAKRSGLAGGGVWQRRPEPEWTGLGSTTRLCWTGSAVQPGPAPGVAFQLGSFTLPLMHRWSCFPEAPGEAEPQRPNRWGIHDDI